MAFHQPTRQAIQRVVRPSVDDAEATRPEASVAHVNQPEESQTWVLFAPTEITTTSDLSETERSLGTVGQSQVSHLGSSRGAARPGAAAQSQQSASLSAIEDESIEDDAELDSLDSHLPEFRSLPGIYSQSHNEPAQDSLPVFPAHDGLGSFRLDQPTLGFEAQEQIYQFERFNPRRQHRRRESLDLTQLDWEHDQLQEAEKRQRIESWRVENSRVLLNEIQRETRRRRLSQTSLHRRSLSGQRPMTAPQTRDAESDNMTWHDEDAGHAPVETEGFLSRITRKVIQDIMGIDDRLLSILLGETVVDPEAEELSTTPRTTQDGAQQAPHPPSSEPWERSMLERMSRELGLLVNQLSHHPGAFSTYARVQHMPLPYAGLPMIPESNGSQTASDNITPASLNQSAFPQFQPTMQSAQPMNAGRSSEPSAEPVQSPRQERSLSGNFTQEEWEKDLDMKLVFRYLRGRFSPRSTSPPSNGTAHLATSSTQDIAAKVARVRQHHPLVSRMRPVERRSFKAAAPTSPVALRHPSSCASQSTRRSARRSSVSSRHYWDIGGSLGTGSVIASNGPMGSWGEV